MKNLQTRNQFLQIIEQTLATTAEGITVADAQQPDLPLIFVNQAFCNITGYSKQEVLGNNCRFLQGEKTEPQAVQQIRSLIRNQQKGIVELVNYRKDGTLFWNRLSLTPIYDEPQNSVSYYLGIQSDITALKIALNSEERFQGMKATLMTVNDIVVNFMYSLQRYRLLMEDPTAVTPELLAAFDQLYETTLQRIQKLNQLDVYREKTIFPGINILDDS